MLWVVLTIVVSLALGIAAERRYRERASATARTMLKVLLYGFTPPVAFLNITGLEITGDVGGGIVIGWVALILAGVLAWAFGRHVLGLRPPSNGVLVNISLQGNTSYLGLPLCAALLGTEHLPAPFIDLPPAYLLAAATPAGLNGLTVAHAYGLDLRYAASSLAWTTGIGVAGMSALALAL